MLQSNTMVEIRKHYPPTVIQRAEPEPEPEMVRRVRNRPSPAEAVANTIELVAAINKLITEKIQSGAYISYYYIYTEVFSCIKEVALKTHFGNGSEAARRIGMKGTTFREAVRSKLTPKQTWKNGPKKKANPSPPAEMPSQASAEP